MKDKNDDSFLTCMNACAKIHVMFGMPIDLVISSYQELNMAFDDVLNTKIDDIPENMLKQYASLRASVLSFKSYVEGKRHANPHGGSWA